MQDRICAAGPPSHAPREDPILDQPKSDSSMQSRVWYEPSPLSFFSLPVTIDGVFPLQGYKIGSEDKGFRVMHSARIAPGSSSACKNIPFVRASSSLYRNIIAVVWYL